jgi:alpha-tubulin suppressor-like RCC1 family protein
MKKLAFFIICSIFVACRSVEITSLTETPAVPPSVTAAATPWSTSTQTPASSTTRQALVVGNDHTCALTAAGAVKCWGNNRYGQLGIDTKTYSMAPVVVNGLEGGVTAIVGAWNHTCALTGSGGVVCWGDNVSAPAEVSGLGDGVRGIATGNGHTCALTGTGGVKCWGANRSGQLGDGSRVDSPVPVDVVGLSSDVTAIAAGGNHTCALIAGGGVKCWGDNSDSQLGSDVKEAGTTPVEVSGLGGVVESIFLGSDNTCARLTGGGFKCWGRLFLFTGGEQSYQPVDVTVGNASPLAVTADWGHVCALSEAGGVECWGWSLGGLGDGKRTSSKTPVEVLGLDSGVTAIAAGSRHTCALMATGGGVKCWGLNDWGELGDGTVVDSPVPVEVVGLDGNNLPPTEAASLVLVKNANCRKGPNTFYDIFTSLLAGRKVEITGRNDASRWDGLWWLVKIQGSKEGCWVAGSTGEVDGSTESTPIVKPPLLPSAPAGFQATPKCKPKGTTQTVQLTWTGAPSATKYRLYRNHEVIATLPADTTSYTDEVPKRNSYSYELASLNDYGASGRVYDGVPVCK